MGSVKGRELSADELQRLVRQHDDEIGQIAGPLARSMEE